MRNVINISLPTEMVKQVKKEVRAGNFASVSEYFRHLLRSRNTRVLAQELKERKKEFESGNGKILRTLKDLR